MPDTDDVTPAAASYDEVHTGLGGSIVGRFERHVAARGHAPAMVEGTRTLSYDELNRRANRVAHGLRARVTGSGVPIAVATPDYLDHFVATIGVLKAGHLVTPLSLDDPVERLAALLRRTSSPLVIAAGPWAENLAALGLGEVTSIERLSTDEPDTDPGIPTSGDDPAVLLFTSGSTGEPKGVITPHRAYNSHVLHPMGGVLPEDRITQVAVPTFITAFYHTFWALLNGATLCRFDPRTEGMGALTDWVRRQRITILNMPPPMLRRWLETVTPGDHFATVRIVTAGGSPMLQTDVELVRRHFPADTVLVNIMGITEAGIATRHIMDRSTPIPDMVVPIGTALPPARVYIIDGHGGEAAPGETGTLHVETPELALGYWNDPELTAATFVANPMGRPGLVYRSGDLAVRDAGGVVTFLGRSDHRVKVSGFAVDTLEVERALAALPLIREASVVAEDRGGDGYLIAYVVPERGVAAIDARAVRTMLAEHLPVYALPRSLVEVGSIPLTDRGKVDLAALRRTVPGRTSPKSRQPGNDDERALLAIWSRILERDDIAVDDHFFADLGGSSIQAMQVFAAITHQLGLHLAPSLLVTAPTIAELARAMRGGDDTPTPALVRTRTTGSKTPFFCVHGGGGGAFFVGDIAKHLDPERPVYGLQEPGLDGSIMRFRTVEETAADYLAEIRGVQPAGPYLLGGLSFGGLVALEMTKQLLAAGERVALLVMIDTTSPQDATVHERRDPGRHMRRIRQGPKEAIRYVTIGLWHRTYYAVQRIRVRWYARRGKRLPTKLSQDHRWRLSVLAHDAYHPPVYDGPVLMVLSAGSGRAGAWQGVLTGPRYQVEIQAGHDFLVVEPHVQEVAAAIDATLAGSADFAVA